MDNNCKYRYDTTNGQASRIAHEHLCRERIVPKETDECTDKCTYKYNQFFAAGDIHYIKISGVFDVTGHIC